jgi:hypothetical protein
MTYYFGFVQLTFDTDSNGLFVSFHAAKFTSHRMYIATSG